MTTELPEMEFQRFWRRLQQLGLNAYEARSYLVLVGHPRFKALELAARAHAPRPKKNDKTFLGVGAGIGVADLPPPPFSGSAAGVARTIPPGRRPHGRPFLGLL